MEHGHKRKEGQDWDGHLKPTQSDTRGRDKKAKVVFDAKSAQKTPKQCYCNFVLWAEL